MAEQIKSLKTGIKYKDTPIGKIPVDWEVVRLNDICDVIGGSTPSTVRKDFWNGDIPFATPTDITNLHGREISDTKQKITQGGLSSCGTRLVPAGSVLLTSRATIGACAINARPMATNQGFASLVCNEKAYNWYIFYEMMLRKSELQRLGSGSTFKEVSKNSLRQLNISLPPLVEQKKIAKILSTVDEAIEKTDQVIEKTKEAKKGLMQRLLNRGIGHRKFKKTGIGELPTNWVISSIGEISNIRRGASPRPIGDLSYFSNIGRGWVRISDVTSSYKYLKNTSQYLSEKGILKSVKVNPGDLIMSICATIGKAIILDSEACIHDGFVLFSDLSEKIDSEFLFYVLQNNESYFVKKGQIGSQGNLNTDIVKRTLFPLPPIPEQKRITEIISTIDAEIEKEVSYRADLERIKTGLMQVLLTGRIRVKA